MSLDPQPMRRWSDERIDDLRARVEEIHRDVDVLGTELRGDVDEIAREMRAGFKAMAEAQEAARVKAEAQEVQRKRDFRTQTVAIIVAVIAAAATLGAAVIATGAPS